jgi:hypothetical protein
MAENVKRLRGRPKGSEKDDSLALVRIAGLLLQGRADNVAAAVRLFAGNDPSLIRRLQRKFRRKRKALLAAAREITDRRARERATWQDEIRRVTRPLDWVAENDPTLRTMAALKLEKQERLTRSIAKSRTGS